MQMFDSDGVGIAYDVLGEGDPILLIHGFASNARVNWVETGWVDALVRAGRQVVLIDNRGHGESEKLYDPELYEAPEMAEDARRLLDHLGIRRADVMGYSMGGRITAFAAIRHPERVRSAIVGGLAENIFRGFSSGDAIAEGLEAERLEDVTEPVPRAFRMFAQHTRSDLRALAACMRSGRPAITREALATIRCPFLVVAGEKDEIAGRIEPLVEAVPGAEGVVLARRDHMTAVGDKAHKQAVLAFLEKI